MFWLGSILSNNGSGPYGVTIWTEDNTKYDFWFKFQWLQYLYQSYAKRNGLKEEELLYIPIKFGEFGS